MRLINNKIMLMNGTMMIRNFKLWLMPKTKNHTLENKKLHLLIKTTPIENFKNKIQQLI